MNPIDKKLLATVGEIINGTTTASTQSFTTTSFVDQTGFSLTLGVGVYDIISETSDSSIIAGTPSANGYLQAIVVIADSSNTVYGESSLNIQHNNTAGCTTGARVRCEAKRVVVSSQATFKIRRKLTGTGNSHSHTSNGSNSDSALGPKFYAIRVI